VPKGQKAEDRGDHSKGKKNDSPMDLIWKAPKKQDPDAANRPPV